MNYGIKGLWYGPTFAVAYNTFWYNVLIACIRWPELIEEARERRNKERELKIQLDMERADKFYRDFSNKKVEF